MSSCSYSRLLFSRLFLEQFPLVLWCCWLASRKGIQPAKNEWWCWRGYLSGARCKWFAYGPADATATLSSLPPFPQIDIIGAMVIVWRVRGKIIRSVLCNIVRNNCAQCNAHTWTDLTVLWIGFCLTGPISLCLGSFLYMYYCMYAYDCNMVRWTWWDWSLSLGLLLPSVLWHCRLGHLTRKTRPQYDL